jgi:AcrR family transcriptional regulator
MTDATIANPPTDTRGKIVDALMELAAERRFEEISITDIATRAGIGLADFRDAFPSKGAVLGAFNRRIDRAVLAGSSEALEGEPAKERLFDVLMRRLDAMAPYREGIRGIVEWTRRDPLAGAALNREALNSMRFMLEASGIESEGPVGTVKLQGLVIAFARILDIWFRDDEPGFPATMAALDRELTRGETIVGRVEDLHRMTSPLRALARAVIAAPFSRGSRGRRRSRDEDIDADDSVETRV